MVSATIKPRISVVMAVRNGAKFLPEAVASILRQDFSDFEFLIVDDGSTDATPALLDGQTDPRIRVFHRPHCGLPASLNFAIAESRADLIARQDADDRSEPARLGTLYSALTAAPQAPLAHCATHALMEDTIVPVRGPYVPRSQALTALILCIRNLVTHGCVLFRKPAFQTAGGYDETFLQSQDYDLWSRMIATGPFAYCPQKLYQFRQHADSMSSRKSAGQIQFARQIAHANCQRFFQFEPAETDRLFDFLSRRDEQTGAAWWRFIRRDLPRLRYQSPELYAWAAVQLARALT